MITSVFFDLDGTLADTALDLTNALNQVLHEQGKPKLSLEFIKPAVALGSNAIVKLAFSIEEDDPEFDKLKERFLKAYQQRLHQDTYIFSGMYQVLDYLEGNNMTWGIVTNKPEWLTKPVIKQLQLAQRAACIISGDTTRYQKPHPGSILHACDVTQSDPETSLYIGDALRDIEAGRAAGMRTLVACYGYIAKNENLQTWNADGYIAKPEEIIDWLKIENRHA